jgi:hypothetical protein
MALVATFLESQLRVSNLQSGSSSTDLDRLGVYFRKTATAALALQGDEPMSTGA